MSASLTDSTLRPTRMAQSIGVGRKSNVTLMRLRGQPLGLRQYLETAIIDALNEIPEDRKIAQKEIRETRATVRTLSTFWR